MNRKKELAINTVIIGIGNLFTKALAFILVPLYTAWLTTSEYGDYDLLFSYVSLVVPTLTLQIEQAVLRYTLVNKDKKKKYFSSSFPIVLINVLIFLLIDKFLLDFKYHYAFSFCTVSFALEVYLIEYLRGCNELKSYSLINILCGIFSLLFSIVFVYKLELGVNGLLVSYGLSYLFVAVFIVIRFHIYTYKFYKEFDLHITKALLIYSLPLLPNAISWWITNVSDRTLINYYLGSQYNGLYAVSCKIPSLISVFFSFFNLAWQQSAILSSTDSKEDQVKFYSSVFNKLNKFLFSSAFLVVSLTPLIYHFFLNKKYYQSITIVPILIFATILLNMSQYIGGILLGKKDTKTNGSTTLIAAIANLIINFLFIKQIGLYAAAISTLISYVIMFVLRLIRVKDLFDYKKIILKSLLILIIACLFSIQAVQISKLTINLLLMALTTAYFIWANKELIFVILRKIGVKL